MKIHSITVGPFEENTYLIAHGNEALLVDPGFSNNSEFSAFKEILEKDSLNLLGVMLTHAHVDHVLGLHQVLQSYDIPVYLNQNDLFLWNNFESQSAMFGLRASGFNFIPEALDEQKDFKIGSLSMDILYTPGHSPDHVSIYLKKDGKLIAGDALFRESIGRTDLYKGDFELLAASIRDKLYKLPGETVVLPGHGPSTSIGYEKENNVFVKE